MQDDQSGYGRRARRYLGDGRRSDAIGDLAVSAVVIRAGLLAGAGLRCRHAAISGGPASAARTVIPASHQPSPASDKGARGAGDQGDGETRADQRRRYRRDRRCDAA